MQTKTAPYYECRCYPGIGVAFDAISDGQRSPLAGVSTHLDWRVVDCRAYARSNGFTAERRDWEDGGAVFRFYAET